MKRSFLLRWCSEMDEERRKLMLGHRFWCPCGEERYGFEGVERHHSPKCPMCHGTGGFYRKLNRREHHALLVAWRQDQKFANRAYAEEQKKWKRAQKARRLAEAFGLPIDMRYCRCGKPADSLHEGMCQYCWEEECESAWWRAMAMQSR